MDKRVGLKRYELDGRKVLLYFDEVRSTRKIICLTLKTDKSKKTLWWPHVLNTLSTFTDWGKWAFLFKLKVKCYFMALYHCFSLFSEGVKTYSSVDTRVVFLFRGQVCIWAHASVDVTLSQIPSQCMTCVAFQAVREFIVGKTAPVPVKIYDYYEPGVHLKSAALVGQTTTKKAVQKKSLKKIIYGCEMNVSIFGYPAFEATRFYNVSESSPLARELCDGPTCNEVESSTNQWIGGP